MSDDAPQPPQPPAPKPTAKTSTVPLKKETVRITLRAKPGSGVTQPKKATAPNPTVTTSPSAPAPPAPPASGVKAPAPPAPPSTGGAPAAPAPTGKPGMQKTQKVTVKAAPASEPAAAPAALSAPAKTVPLSQPRPAATPASTQALPKATVKLQQTQPLATGPAATGNIGSVPASNDSQVLLEDEEPTGFLPFSIILGILSLVAMALAILTSDKLMARPVGQSSGLPVPAEDNPKWEKSNGEGGWIDNFTLPEVPLYER